MNKRCSNCANAEWLDGERQLTDVCVKCNWVGVGENKEPSNWKPKTNAERIRSASDEELAEIMLNTYRNACQGKQDRSERCSEYGCKDCIQEWLQQPAKEGANGKN